MVSHAEWVPLIPDYAMCTVSGAITTWLILEMTVSVYKRDYHMTHMEMPDAGRAEIML